MIHSDGTPKPAAALLAPDAPHDVTRVPVWARFLKPFWFTLLAVVVVSILIIKRILRHRALRWRKMIGRILRRIRPRLRRRHTDPAAIEHILPETEPATTVPVTPPTDRSVLVVPMEYVRMTLAAISGFGLSVVLRWLIQLLRRVGKK